MKFNKTTEYALRILSYMAKDEKKSYSTSEIYDALKIPFRYLRRLMTDMTKTGLIKSIQGKYGGFQFEKKINDISMFDIVKSSDENYFNTQCFFGFQTCSLNNICIMHNEWARIRIDIEKTLSKTKLSDVNESDLQLNS